MILSWGKCKITHAGSVQGAPVGNWNEIDTPKEGTTKLTPTAGTEKTATAEGGGIVDAKYNRNTFVFEFYLFVKKGQTAPFSDDDGIVSGEHAFRVVPEDDLSCEGIQIDRCNIRVDLSYSTDEGKMLHHYCKCLRPATGATVKPYTEGGLTVDKSELFFGNAADSTGKAVTATSTGNVSAVSSESWCTVSCAGKVATVKVSANSGTTARVAYVTITADEKTAIIKVTQIPA